MNNNKQNIEDLESIIRLLADVWPADRDDVAVAGAKFEQFTNNFDDAPSHLSRLIDLGWEGIKYLFQEDDYFMMVKAATLQAVNMVREYLVAEGDVRVEDFEKAYEDLSKALSGGSESADSVIEMDEETVQQKLKEKEDEENRLKAEAGEALNVLAAFIIELNEDELAKEDIKELYLKVDKAIGEEEGEVLGYLKKAKSAIEQITPEDFENPADWLNKVSGYIDTGIEVRQNEYWGEPDLSEMEEQASAAETEQVASEESGVNSVQENKPGTSEPVHAEESDVENVASGISFVIPEDFEITMVNEFITECSELIEMAESALLDLEASPEDDELINTVFRSFHTIKGTSAFMGLECISEFTHYVETLLSMVREGDMPFDHACADINLDSIDILKQLLSSVENCKIGDTINRPAQYNSMMRVLNAISNHAFSPADAIAHDNKVHDNEYNRTSGVQDVAEETGEGDAPEKAGSERSSGKSDSESSVRVSVNRLDRLIDMVGELVIAHSVVAQDKGIPKDSELHKKVNHATKILRELQDTSLTLRMVPLKATFHKMNRLVRDLSRKAGKKVNFHTIGEDTEIDRNMVDIINEPLIHMLRNALDHGIENPEERSATGKEPVANISLRASQEGGKVLIEIKDDGRGIDKDIILRKAIEKDLIDPEKKLTEKEIYGLIFLPGFSSAEKVTDLSGRGVGMDVVKRSIEQLQGKIEVWSELGKGTRITIELPFTLAITDGMLVKVGSQRFIIPTINIDMTFRVEEKDLYTVMGDSEQVNFRGKSVPVIRLHRLFEIKEATEELTKGTMLVIKNNNTKYALLVDEVIGQQQLVGKSIDMNVKMTHISGGAILGDGQVGLILDTAAIVDFAA